MDLTWILNKNAILSSPVDKFCLVCDRILRSEDESITHINIPLHLKNLNSAPVLDKYMDDNIIKVKQGYYCINCNIFIKTVMKVGLHIKEDKHKNNKEVRSLQWQEGILLCSEDVQIQEYAWHALFENSTCLICNTDVTASTLDNHIKDNNHVIELIKNKCVFGPNYIYRMIEEDIFFCVICAKVLNNDVMMSNHHTTEEHINCCDKGKELAKESLNKEKGQKITTERTAPKVETQNAAKKIKDNTKNKKVDDNDKKEDDATTKNKLKTINKGAQKEAQRLLMKSFGSSILSKLPKDGHPNVNITQEINNFFESLKTNYDDCMGYVNDMTPLHQLMYKKVLDDDFIDKLNPPSCLLCDNPVIRNGDVQKHLRSENHKVKLMEHKTEMYLRFTGLTQDDLNEYTEKAAKKMDVSENEGNTGIATEKIVASVAKDNTKKAPEQFVALEAKDNIKNANGKLKVSEAKDNTNNTTEKTVASDKSDTASKLPPNSVPSKKAKPEQKKKKAIEADISYTEDEDNLEKEYEKFIKNDISIDFDTDSAYCKRCDEDLELDSDILEEHLKEHSKTFEATDLDAEITQFCYENYMRVIDGKAFCKLCEEDVNTNLEDMKDHVNFYIHKDIVLSKTGHGPLTKTTAKEFFNTLVRVESLVPEVIVNNNYVITLKSFHTIIDVNRDMSCSLCEQDLKQKNGDIFMQHIASVKHKELLASCNVVTSMQNEFVRELRPGVYHCGYCNIPFLSWFLTVAHIASPTHHAAKRNASWSLERSKTVARHGRPINITGIDQVTIE